ncbi:hypothetical protein EDD37DRAFT_612505 [Exophiala viscosa]|uniref:Uncharacterized protein n=1 Tax=Exophiala viscosa TaxID=2486360 RepID=A0AAN6DPZ4_9EURO|nr:hypothetical protein EDD36DRAFT_482399 [Exophiala viscosa]KAI1621057.1 hypothetical protein EDD37DRAFT_612505 [Exophiala viscosa]
MSMHAISDGKWMDALAVEGGALPNKILKIGSYRDEDSPVVDPTVRIFFQVVVSTIDEGEIPELLGVSIDIYSRLNSAPPCKQGFKPCKSGHGETVHLQQPSRRLSLRQPCKHTPFHERQSHEVLPISPVVAGLGSIAGGAGGGRAPGGGEKRGPPDDAPAPSRKARKRVKRGLPCQRCIRRLCAQPANAAAGNGQGQAGQRVTCEYPEGHNRCRYCQVGNHTIAQCTSVPEHLEGRAHDLLAINHAACTSHLSQTELRRSTTLCGRVPLPLTYRLWRRDQQEHIISKRGLRLRLHPRRRPIVSLTDSSRCLLARNPR